jgi:hypothetical protein
MDRADRTNGFDGAENGGEGLPGEIRGPFARIRPTR